MNFKIKNYSNIFNNFKFELSLLMNSIINKAKQPQVT